MAFASVSTSDLSKKMMAKVVESSNLVTTPEILSLKSRITITWTNFIVSDYR